MEEGKHTENSSEFVEVRRKTRKRKQNELSGTASLAMDTSERAAKRPNLPAISGDNLVVSI